MVVMSCLQSHCGQESAEGSGRVPLRYIHRSELRSSRSRSHSRGRPCSANPPANSRKLPLLILLSGHSAGGRRALWVLLPGPLAEKRWLAYLPTLVPYDLPSFLLMMQPVEHADVPYRCLERILTCSGCFG